MSIDVSTGEGHETQKDRETWEDRDREGLRKETPPPRIIGRYRVLETLGAGGMGTVYAAHDPELDRKVAVKLLHTHETFGDHQTRARSRLQREARAIAQVKHPNVIHVYDVGVHVHEGAEQVFVAMELVEGRSFRAWIEQLHGTERWQRGQALDEIVQVMAQAGHGLAAAHRAGLVHRDFKPDNALLGDDGLVRVVDFGLARRADAGTDSINAPLPAELDTNDSGALDDRITRTGAALGTPRYMAPEQFRGEAIDGRADQFAFCLTLFEALFGTQAFPHRSHARRAMAVIAGERRAFPDRPVAPAHLKALLERGLQVDPDDRHPSMDALVTALLDDPVKRRRERLRWLVGGTVVAATLGVTIATRPAPPPPEDVCGHGQARMEAVWTPEREQAVDRALRLESLPYADDVATATRDALATYADEWMGAHRDACEATHVRHEQTGALLDLRMACLDRRLAALDASSELLAAAEPEQVEHAVDVAEGLPSLATCADRAALEATGPPPPDDAKRDAVAEVYAQLERASARERLHRFDEALAMVEALAPRVDAIGHPPLHAEFLHARGTTLVRADQFEPGHKALHDALMRAQALGMDMHVRDVASELSQVLGVHLARPEDALPWADLAEATDERIGPTPATRAELLRARAWVLVAWGMKPDAIDVVARAYEAALEAYEPDAFEMIAIYSSLGIVYAQLRELDKALPHFKRAARLTEQHMGKSHPGLIATYRNIGNALSASGEPDEAERYLQRAADLVERIPGVGANDQALIASSLGNLAMQRRDFERGLEYHQRALELREQVYGPEHPMVARSLNSLAGSTKELGRIEEGIALYQRSLAIREKAMGPEHPSLLLPIENLGVLLAEQRRFAEAVPYLERSYALMLEHGGVPKRRAQHDSWLGRALVESGKDPVRGMTLVEDARARLKEVGAEDDVATLERWLKARRTRR